MKYLVALLAVALGLACIPAQAQQLAVARVVATCGTTSPTPHAGASYPLTIDITGTLCTAGGGGGGGNVVITGPLGISQTPAQSVAVTNNPASGASGQTSVSVGLTSTTLIAAAACKHYSAIIVNPAETSPVWVNENGASATTAAPSIELLPGMSIVHTAFIPSGTVSGIVATGSANPTVECF